MKKRVINGVLIAVIIMNAVLSLCGCGGAASKKNKEYFELLKTGDEALADGRFDDALTAYQQAIDNDPTVPQAYHRLFDTYVRDERYDDALAFVFDHYQDFSTEMAEGSDEPYEEEGSMYAGLTPRQEASAFLLAGMDLGLHKGSYIESVYPDKQTEELVAYVTGAQEALAVDEMAEPCKNAAEISAQYADLVKKMQDAGVLVSADLKKMSGQQLAELNLSDPDPQNVRDAQESEALITLETAAELEKELRALLEKDPDLIFLYLDIANLYIQAGDREKAEAAYQEGVKALADMRSRRGYLSEDVIALLDAQFSNLYRMGYIAAAATATTSSGGYYFLGPDSGEEQDGVTPEQYLQAMEDALNAADELSLSDSQKKTINNSYNRYSSKLKQTMENVSSASAPETPTEVEGDAELVMIGTSLMSGGTFDPDNGWLRLYCGYGKGYGCPEDIVNVKTGQVILGEEGAEPRLCNDALIQYQWRERESGKEISIYNVAFDSNDEETKAADLYMITYDLDGSQLEEEMIYEKPDGALENSMNDVYNVMQQSAAGHSERYEDIDYRKASVEDGRIVFDVSGVRFSRPLADDQEISEWGYRAYVYSDIVVLNWEDYSQRSKTEIYMLP